MLSRIFCIIQRTLLPALEEETGPLSEPFKQLVRVVELADLGRYAGPGRPKVLGRTPENRLALLTAFVAKAVYNLPTTRALIERVTADPVLRRFCGWDLPYDIPSESTFSRAFAEFAEGDLPQRIHEAMIKKHLGGKLVGHVSRDSTAIQGREKPARKEEPAAPPVKAKRGRPRKDEVREAKAPRRLEVQPGRTLKENLADLPAVCDRGGKKDSKGNTMYWIGYKAHLDWSDAGVPLSLIVSSASLHDSQASIPLSQMTSTRIVYLYELMDAAYDSAAQRDYSANQGRVALIDLNRRSGKDATQAMDPAQRERYKERTTAERGNSDLKDNYGWRFVRVRGAVKVAAHLSFGLIALAAERLFGMLVT